MACVEPANAADRLERGRPEVGEDGAKGRGGEARLIEVRREIEAGEVCAFDDEAEENDALPSIEPAGLGGSPAYD